MVSCESMSNSTKEENEFTHCITQSFQLVYYIMSSKIISLCHITEPLLLYCSLYTQFPCYFYQVCFIQNIKLYMFIVENREIQKSMMKKITLMKKINIIHNSTSGSIFGVFSLKYIHIYIYISIYIYIYICSYLHYLYLQNGEGNGTPLQYSCLENTMDGGAWQAAVHGVVKSQTRLSDFTFTFHFHALEKEMATHSSVLAWRIPGTVEPGGLTSMGLQSQTRLKRLSSSSRPVETKLFCIQKCQSLSHARPFVTPPGSCVHLILQARILEWVAIPFSRGSSRPRDQTQVSCMAGRFFIT